MDNGGRKLHIAMFPWFAMGHIKPFLDISNKLASKGHKISFLVPGTNTLSKLNTSNLHPHLISFVLLTVPRVDGLPPNVETTTDIPFPLHPTLMTAMDNTETIVESILLDLKPDLVLFDFAHWIPALTRRLGIRSMHYCIISAASIAYLLSPERKNDLEEDEYVLDMTKPPLSFPVSVVKFHPHEARSSAFFRKREFGSGMKFHTRQMISLTDCDAIGFKSCKETEGPFVEYLEKQFKKPILLSGPVIPEPPSSALDEKWVKWLSGFKEGSVVYCALGSESKLKKDQYIELVLGLELAGFPFLAALKSPTEEDSLPQGFEKRVEGRGIVEGGWVQQQLILAHPSVGCFVTHCGSGSLTEALVNDCQIVLLPQYGDQIVNARVMGGDLRVGVEIEKGKEDGLFTKESVSEAVKLVMDQNNEVAKEVRSNHSKWKNVLLRDGFFIYQ